MDVLFERFSWLHFIGLFGIISKAGGFYLLEENPIHGASSKDLKSATRILKLLFPRINIRRIHHEDFPRECFEANIGVVDFIEKNCKLIVNSPTAKSLFKLYGDKRIHLALKKGVLLNRYGNAYYLYRMADAHAQKNGKSIYVVPNIVDWLGVFSCTNRIHIHKKTRLINGLIDQFRSLYQIFRYLGSLIVGKGGMRGLITTWRKSFTCSGRPSNKNQCNAKYAIQVPWRFRKTQQTNSQNVKRNRWDSSFLEDGGEFSRDKLVYVYYRSDLHMKDDISFHNDRGVYCCDEKDLMPDFRNYVFGMLIPGIKITASLFREWIKMGVPSDMAHTIVSLMYWINLYERFAAAFQPRVYMGFDDQGISCIARSIVFRKHNIKTAAIHHSSLGGLYINHDIAFLSVDKLFLYGSMWNSLYSPYWDSLAKEVVGVLRSDLIHESSFDNHRRDKFLRKYGQKNKKVLVCPPGTGAQNIESRVDDFYKSLQRLSELRNDTIIILKPRSLNTPNPRQKKILEPGIESGRILIEWEDFDTWELIAYCDLVISSQTSSVLSEAFTAGKNAFSFSFSGIDDLATFYHLNPLLVAKTGLEMIDRVNLMLDNKDCITNYQRIQQKLGQPMDGKVVERIRKSLRALADQPEACAND